MLSDQSLFETTSTQSAQPKGIFSRVVWLKSCLECVNSTLHKYIERNFNAMIWFAY